MLVVDSSIFPPQMVHVLGPTIISEEKTPKTPAWRSRSVMALVVSLTPRGMAIDWSLTRV